MPVSYTHLDVYKRQLVQVSVQPGDAFGFWGCRQCPTQRIFADHFPHAQAVSYTHLDVYKRQVLKHQKLASQCMHLGS